MHSCSSSMWQQRAIMRSGSDWPHAMAPSLMIGCSWLQIGQGTLLLCCVHSLVAGRCMHQARVPSHHADILLCLAGCPTVMSGMPGPSLVACLLLQQQHAGIPVGSAIWHTALVAAFVCASSLGGWMSVCSMLLSSPTYLHDPLKLLRAAITANLPSHIGSHLYHTIAFTVASTAMPERHTCAMGNTGVVHCG
jgi:hypothetical protein